MAKFTVRIELHDAREEDYPRLHAAMQEKGFLRTIEAEGGHQYYLPTAEYNFDGPTSIDTVFDYAKSAAETIKRQFEILVTESNGRKWINLKSAN